MNKMLEMMMQMKMKQMPQAMIKQLEQQVKRINPQAFKEYQQARNQNKDPNEYLNNTINSFDADKRQQWEQMMQNLR